MCTDSVRSQQASFLFLGRGIGTKRVYVCVYAREILCRHLGRGLLGRWRQSLQQAARGVVEGWHTPPCACWIERALLGADDPAPTLLCPIRYQLDDRSIPRCRAPRRKVGVVTPSAGFFRPSPQRLQAQEQAAQQPQHSVVGCAGARHQNETTCCEKRPTAFVWNVHCYSVVQATVCNTSRKLQAWGDPWVTWTS
jgi:hypothetical protein